MEGSSEGVACSGYTASGGGAPALCSPSLTPLLLPLLLPCTSPSTPSLGLSHSLLPLETLTGLKLEVEEMALTAPSQRRKLEVVLEAVNGSLQVGEQQLKWSVASM